MIGVLSKVVELFFVFSIQVFTQVRQYKGNIVAIKRVNKKYVDLTRNVRKELKVVRHKYLLRCVHGI